MTRNLVLRRTPALAQDFVPYSINDCWMKHRSYSSPFTLDCDRRTALRYETLEGVRAVGGF
jgi:hypothetical protein